MSEVAVAIIGAGPYGLSLAAHLRERNVEHRLLGRPMQFWAQVAEAASERYLKSFCFATNLSAPRPGFAFGDYNHPRGLPTFEPCSIGNFAAYGQWFQQHNVPGIDPVDVTHVARSGDRFAVTTSAGERFVAAKVVVATGLSCFAQMPSVLSSLPNGLATHTSRITSFSGFKGSRVAVVGAGQSALEAAALLHEAGALPQLLVREQKVLWHSRVLPERTLWQRLRSPVSGLGVGPKAWALFNFPGGLHRLPDRLRTRLTKNHLPPEGAWWLRPRVENLVPVHCGTTIAAARESGSGVHLQLRHAHDHTERELQVDHVISGSGYRIDVERLHFLDPKLRAAVDCLNHAPRLNAAFESSIPGLHFVGPTSAISFGPLFRFVVGADYTARVVSQRLAAQVSAHVLSQVSCAAA